MVGSTLLHYRIRERLGAGGMGEVYLADDTRLGRAVALKVLPAAAQGDPERRARFLNEARAASALQSAHIATLFDIGEHDGSVYLVMEFIEGESLGARLTRGPLRLLEAVSIGEQVADALAEAHARGIVHRDIKPANIVVTPRGQAKVLDFGLAKILTAGPDSSPVDAATLEPTLVGVVMGTASYMSPEQALGRAVDARTDLFSLGVVLYEMIAGRLPFTGATFGEVTDAILNQTPPPLARFSNEVTPAIEHIVRKALEKNLAFRYQTARDLYIDLHHLHEQLEADGRDRSSGSRPSGRLARPQVDAAPDNSIAVITFTNITREPGDEWIGSGIAETVTADLKNVPGVTVIGRERIFDALRNIQSSASGVDDRFAIDIGLGLGARWIVTGGYQRFGDRLRITARIVEVQTGVVLRNVKIDGALADIFSLQDRIVFELTEDLQLQLETRAIDEIRKPETRSVEAYELYSRGVLIMRMATRDSPDRAINMFEKALAIDPGYAEAWAGLGAAYQLKGNMMSIPELLHRAIEYERKALGIDPNLADAYTWLGSALLGLGRVDEAIAALQDSLRLDPGQARAHSALARAYWIGKGQVPEGIASLERAVELNPQFGYAYLQLAHLYTEIGEFRKAEDAARRAIDLQEQYVSGEEGLLIVGAHTRLGYALYRQGRFDEAIREYQTELVFLSAADHVLKERSLIELHQKLGAAYLRIGQRSDAERHLKLAIKGYEERLAAGTDDPATKYYAAVAYTLQGDTDRALRYLRESLAGQGPRNRRRIAADPDLETVRAELGV